MFCLKASPLLRTFKLSGIKSHIFCPKKKILEFYGKLSLEEVQRKISRISNNRDSYFYLEKYHLDFEFKIIYIFRTSQLLKDEDFYCVFIQSGIFLIIAETIIFYRYTLYANIPCKFYSFSHCF